MTARGGFTDRLSSILSTPTPHPTAWLSILLAVVAATVGVTATRARYITAISTLIHETGHALAAILTGGGVHVIRIHDHESGVAYTWYWSRAASVVSSFAGYATPPLAGLGAAHLIVNSKAAAALAVLALVAALVLLVTRDITTVAIVALIGGTSAALFWWGSPGVQAIAATAVAWLLLVSEAVHLAGLAVNRYVRGVWAHGDEDALAEGTGIPALVWMLAWWALNAWCVWMAAPLLIP